jgi:hypothetical protein
LTRHNEKRFIACRMLLIVLPSCPPTCGEASMLAAV